MNIKLKATAYILLAFWAGYQAHNNKLFPISRFVERNFFPPTEAVSKEQKRVNVFSDISMRKEVSCPKAADGFIVVGFGQSNSANSAGHRFASTKSNVLNLFNGKCYEAIDPMLGATGHRGSVWISFAEKLGEVDKTIVLSTFGVNGTRVEQWLNKNDLNPFYRENIESLKSVYPNPNIVVWIQGESDTGTDKSLFTKQLREWMSTVRKDLPNTQILMTGTSYCDGAKSDEVVAAQKDAAEYVGASFIGSTDNLVGISERYDDCHFSEQGIRKLAEFLVGGVKR